MTGILIQHIVDYPEICRGVKQTEVDGDLVTSIPG